MKEPKKLNKEMIKEAIEDTLNEDSMIILEDGIDLAGNYSEDLSKDSCENFITFAPNITKE